MRISTNFCGFSVAILCIVCALHLDCAWATTAVTKNCPAEPAQGVTIISGETYYGTKCVLSTSSDLDTFQFTAAAGDVWRVFAGSPLPDDDNICLKLYSPGNTTPIFSGCSNSEANLEFAGTTQALTLAGTYTVALTETANTSASYGISVERVNPAPPDGAPLVLGKTITGAIHGFSAQNAFTFAGATTGTFQIATSIVNPASNTTNLCLAIYQPGGTIAVSTPSNRSVSIGVRHICSRV